VACLIVIQAPAHAAAGAGMQAPGGLDVQPFPGTPDASPQTQIAFPALMPWQLKNVVVRGSESGLHAGRLVALGGRGIAFLPDRPFSNGEQVSVLASLSSRAAGRASGAGNATRISFGFGVSAPLVSATAARAHTAVRHDIRDSNGFTHTYHSISWIHPPIVSHSGSDPDPSEGYIFGDAQETTQPGPIILDPQGNLVYFQPLGQQSAYNVQVQNYQGQQVLTYWQGYAGHFGVGQGMIYDHHYHLVTTVNAGNGYKADEHEFLITPQGDAFISIYAPVPANLSSIGGPTNGTILDSIIQEINIATGQVLWEWHAYGHVHIAESYAGKPTSAPYDFFHINSIQPLANGNLLVSARQTWALYEINMQTGKIAYNIGGKHSSFKIGPGANFEWQHDAQMLSDGSVTLFDDGAGYFRSESQSRALHISLNYARRQVSLLHAFTNSPSLLTNTQGSMQTLPDGNVFVCFGGRPYFTEFTPSGHQVFSAWFPSPLQSYRGYRSTWWGQPDTQPSIAVSRTSTGTTVYASWNGATDVSSWQVLAGPSPSQLTSIGRFPKTFFETTIKLTSTQPYFEVQALGADGGVRASSNAVAR
jgi:hypothetical protein